MAITMEPIYTDRCIIQLDGSKFVLIGSLDVHDSGDMLEDLIKKLHSQIMDEGLTQIKVDLTRLKFINSPAISVFAEWITMVEESPEDKRYKIVFVCNIKEHMWQEATISSLEFINPDYVKKEVVL